jgi:hypothetical protein
VAKKNKELTAEEYSYGQVSVIPASSKDVPATYPKVADVLVELNNTNDVRSAIDVIISKTPDGKAALNTYLRLANQGIKIEWFNKNTGKRTKRYDGESDAFCSYMGLNNASGLDGLIDQFHYGAVISGGMAAEVVVSKGADEIDEVVIVDVSTIDKFVWDDKLKRYRIYQKQDGMGGKAVDLCEGNFFYIPNEPKPGSPKGTLQFESAVYSMAHYLKLMRDSNAVLERIGYPRYNTSIDDEKWYASLPGSVRNDPVKLKEAATKYFNEVKAQCALAGYNSDFIAWGSVKREQMGGNSSLGVDVRSFTEITDIEIPQSFTIPPIIMGRGQGKGSYALGTVEMEILVGKIESMRRASKRIIENIMNLWARVKGYNITCKVTHNAIDWEKQIDKLTAQLKKLELYRRLDEYGYIERDDAARNVADVEKAEGKKPPDGSYEYLKQSSTGTDKPDDSGKTKTEEDTKDDV